MIDTRELHIGAHVDVRISDLIEHKRVRICRTNDDNEVCYKRANDKGLLTAYAYHLEPIPFTAELLTEIGFEQSKGFSRDWHMEIGINLITVHFFLDRKTARIFVSGGSKDYGNLLCRYLHEAENFVYMTLHKELINE